MKGCVLSVLGKHENHVGLIPAVLWSDLPLISYTYCWQTRESCWPHSRSVVVRSAVDFLHILETSQNETLSPQSDLPVSEHAQVARKNNV